MGKLASKAGLRAGFTIGASALALSVATQADAQTCAGTVVNGLCVITNSGTSGTIALTGPARLNNSGTIIGTTGVTTTAPPTFATPFQLRQSSLIITNGTTGTITGTSGMAVNGPGLLLNSGTITGNVTGLTTYIADGGTLNGSLQLGAAVQNPTGETFVQRGATTGITGSLTAGNGVDFYIRSYASTGAVTLGAALPTTFEVEGVEALGSGTTLTLSAPNAVKGLMLMGEGTVINTATIGTFNSDGANLPANASFFPTAVGYAGVPGVSNTYFVNATAPNNTQFVAAFIQGAALNGFTNQGTINGDLRLGTASFINSGAINLQSRATGTLVFTAANKDFLFNNSGDITLTYNGARVGAALNETYLGDDDAGSAMRILSAFDSNDLKNVQLKNSGTIAGGMAANVVGKTVAFENSGTISGINQSDYQIRAVELDVGELPFTLRTDGEDELAADSVTFLNTATGKIIGGVDADIGAASFSFDNRGSITNSATTYGSEAAVYISQGLFESDADEAAGTPGKDATALTFANSGSIEGVQIDSETQTATLSNSGAITTSILPFNSGNPPYYGGRAAFEYQSETTGNQNLTFTNTGSVIGSDKGSSGVVISTDAGDSYTPVPLIASANIKVVNSGTIRSDGGATLTPGTFLGFPQNISVFHPVAALVVNAAGVSGTSTVTIENQAGGVIGTNGVLNAVTPNGYVTLASNSNRAQTVAVAAAATRVNITNAGLIEGGTGSDYSANPNVYVDVDLYLPNRYIAGAIQTTGAGEDPSIGSIDHVVNTATGVIKGSIDLGANDDIIENYGSITGNIFLRDGNDTFIQSLKAVMDGTVDGGAGTDTLSFDITDSDGIVSDALRAKFINFEIETFIGTGKVVTAKEVVLGDGGALKLEEGSSVNVGAGNTAISGSETVGETVTNGGSITGNVDMRGGNNVVTNQGNVTGNVSAGDGNNVLANQGTITGNLSFGNGANQVTNTGTVTGNVALGQGGNTVANQGTISGNVTAGSGNDRITNSGHVDGVVNLGAGNNELVMAAGSTIGGYNGTAGRDTVQATFSGTEAQRQTLDLSGFEAVEQFNVNGGVGAYTGNASFETVSINGGRLIGAAGSTLSGNVNVASGGTFGSAGTVAGNIGVGSGGTFSPGASPAVMTVNGNVALASGSNTVFEFVPAPGQSDQLIINGNLTIAAGTTLNMTGNRPLTPGVAYDMITATSITGTFTTVNQASTVQGFLRYTANKLQLLGTFLPPTGVSTQTGGTISYVNTVLTSGQASSALLTAVPSLLSSTGTASPTAFAQLNAESYATATQIGTEHGLNIAKASRNGAITSPLSDAGLFSFAQGLGDWRSFKGNGTTGVSRATSHSYGVLGGIGFGNQMASVGAFVGYIDSRQRIANLGTTTNANGVFAGLCGHFAANGFDLNATVAHDWSDADTTRAVPSATVSSSYNLRSFVLDASAGYSVKLGDTWAVRPEAGITHVSTKRAAVTETGSAAFALNVDGGRAKATFIDGAIALRGGQNDGATVRPWAQVGVRHQLDGATTSASGGFVGSTARFVALGAERKDTIVTAGAGVSADLAPRLTFFGSYLGEFGGGNGSNVNVGIRFAF